VEAIVRGLDGGSTWIDTAEVYGGGGGSETIVSRALHGRDGVLVFTKVAPQPDGTGVRPAQIRAALDNSRRRLGREVIDLFQLHWRDPEVPLEDTWETMADLASEGAVRWIGVSNLTLGEVRQCALIRRVDTVQIQGSILHDEELRSFGQWARETGTGIIAYGALGFGILSASAPSAPQFDDWRGGSYGRDDFFVDDNYRRHFEPSPYARRRELASSLGELSHANGITLPQLALAWVARQPGVTGVLAGTRTPEHAEENAAAGTIEFDDATWDEVERLRSALAEPFEGSA
jgi:aryl-alcohol dehydrogenase-like predicted oxidoreductase